MRLAKRGVPVEQIAFIHDAKSPAERAKLFDAVNAGRIRVLIGSTEKMGTGMNVQERCVALHTITPPWRPADIEQQVGRVIRQGNLLPRAGHFVHVTEGSFDAYVWQLLENKASFISQLASGSVNEREFEDVNDAVLSFSEIKALASGNPMVMQLIVLQAELSRMSAVRSSWESSRDEVRRNLRVLELKKQEVLGRIEVYRRAIQVREANTQPNFSIRLKPSIDADTLLIETDREAAGRRVQLLAAEAAVRLLSAQRTLTQLEIGEYRGFPISVTVTGLDVANTVTFFTVGNEILPIATTTEIGTTRSMDIRLHSLDTILQEALDRSAAIERGLSSDQAEMDQPWCHEENYRALAEKVTQLDALLRQDKAEATPVATIPTPQFARAAVAAKRDTTAEVQQALDAIRAMMTDPAIVQRLGGELLPVPIPVEESEPSLFGMNLVVQYDLFGEAVPVTAKKSRRR
jgi:hypothetical protein